MPGWEEQVGDYCNEMCRKAKVWVLPLVAVGIQRQDLVFGVSSVRVYAEAGSTHVELVEEAVERCGCALKID